MNLLAPPRLALLLGLGLALTACGNGGDDDDDVACADLVAGDLVITEVFANPAGEDDGAEWFEIYNAASTSLDVAGLDLVARKADGTGEKTHRITALTIEPDDYAVVGDVVPDLAPAWVDYGYGNALGSMVNGGGQLAILCGGLEIDALAYPEAPGDGVSTILDGATAPDHLANDEEDNLCASESESSVASGVIGSPGEANEACNVVVPGTCNDGGTMRAVNSPGAGELAISEFMPSPDVVADDVGAWVVVYGAADVDLNRVLAGPNVGTPNAVIESADCVEALAGSYLVFARSDDPELNGGLADVVATFNFSLVGGTAESPGSIWIGVGETVLDEVAWTDSENGASSALTTTPPDPAANDLPENFAICEAPYGADGNLGSPGLSNDNCGALPAQCLDGEDMRDIAFPREGDLLVTEVLADPDGTSNDVQEFVEIVATADVDLNGVQLYNGATLKQTFTSEDGTCIQLLEGDRILLAHTTDAGMNGNLPTPFEILLAFASLVNSGDNTSIVLVADGETVHTLDYPDTTTGSDGKAFQLDPDGTTTCVTPETVPYGGKGQTNLGSPGAANAECP
jgi:hypothetical protein